MKRAIFLSLAIGILYGCSKNSSEPSWQYSQTGTVFDVNHLKSGNCEIYFEFNEIPKEGFGYVKIPEKECNLYKKGDKLWIGVKTHYRIINREQK